MIMTAQLMALGDIIQASGMLQLLMVLQVYSAVQQSGFTPTFMCEHKYLN